jgi:hypothetical protein
VRRVEGGFAAWFVFLRDGAGMMYGLKPVPFRAEVVP